MGEHDVGEGTMENNPKISRTIGYWAARYNLPDFEHQGGWRNGRYLNKEWRTAEKVPMLRLNTALEKSHCIMPQEPLFCYDKFLCHFR